MKIIAKIPAWMLLCLFTLSPITETVYTSGLPSITEYFNTDGSTTQITSILYYLGFALGILTLGRLSDIYGRRPVVLFGLCIYTISFIISIFAPNIETLMLARFVQAFGVSVVQLSGRLWLVILIKVQNYHMFMLAYLHGFYLSLLWVHLWGGIL